MNSEPQRNAFTNTILWLYAVAEMVALICIYAPLAMLGATLQTVGGALRIAAEWLRDGMERLGNRLMLRMQQ